MAFSGDIMVQAELQALRERVSELTGEKFRLQHQLQDLRFELAKHGADPTYAERVQERLDREGAEVTRRELRSAELQGEIDALLDRLRQLGSEAEKRQAIRDTLGDEVSEVLIFAMDKREKRQRLRTIAGSFLLGALASLAASYAFEASRTAWRDAPAPAEAPE